MDTQQAAQQCDRVAEIDIGSNRCQQMADFADRGLVFRYHDKYNPVDRGLYKAIHVAIGNPGKANFYLERIA